MNDQPKKAGGLLFGEDFDRPPAPPPEPEPDIVAPVYSAADLDAAREEAARESREAAVAECGASAKADAARALAAIARQIAEARAEVAAIAEDSATAVTRLLMDCFAIAFPALSGRHGPDEAAAVLREILPLLRREPKISVRVSPHIAADMTAEIQALDPDLAAHIRLIPTDAVAEGDVRIAWDHGEAVRDARSLWNQIEAVLAPAGLLTAGPSASVPPLTQQTRREQALVE